ncbi:MAG: alpha/beta hydrolase [Gemmatimonadetes bacterium]|nr:alpha/beta hydrolase [Gemmatimonadota bacterium]
MALPRMRALAAVLALLLARHALAQGATVDTPRGAKVAVFADLPAGRGPFAAVVLGPGAEYPMHAPVLEATTKELVARGIAVYRFDWAYYTADPKAGRASPGLKNEVEDMTSVVAYARRDARVAGDRLFAAGKSLGSLVAWRVLEADTTLRGGLLLTPVCSRTRDGIITAVADQNYPGIASERRPLAFIAGEQDPLCASPVLYGFAARAGGPARVAVVGGNHTFEEPSLPADARLTALQRNVDLAGRFAADFVARNARP